MTCIQFKLGDGTTGIASFGDGRVYCFYYKNRWHRFEFDKRWGPMKVDLIGEFPKDQDWTKDHRFCKAFDVWMALSDEEKAVWLAEQTPMKADEYGYVGYAWVPSKAARAKVKS